MVLQAGEKVPVWGWAGPGEKVTVTLADRTAETQADVRGRWQTELNLAKSGPGPFQLKIDGSSHLVIEDVLVGEVWLASGQSNMELPMSQTIAAKTDIAASANPQLRLYKGPHDPQRRPQIKGQGTWSVAAPGSVGKFSGVAYYFSKSIQETLKVPVGIIDTSVGGTLAEIWISQQGLDQVPALKAKQQELMQEADTYDARTSDFRLQFARWLREHQREDHPMPDNKAFSARDVDLASWKPVHLPTKFAAAGLPDAGAVWFRREVPVSEGMAHGGDLRIDTGGVIGYAEVYWDGVKVGETTYLGNPGFESKFTYMVPVKLVKPGKSVLAIRIYNPVGAAELRADSSGSNFRAIRDGNNRFFLEGEWQARVEYSLPALPPGTPPAPEEPRLPPEGRAIYGELFNGHINPLIPYALRGVIWYQGEGNVGHGYEYRSTFPLLIDDWRRHWNRPDLPFYFCQLPNYGAKRNAPGDSQWAELREAQAMTQSLPHTGMAVLIDIGEEADLHPRDKKDAGQRLARVALHDTYGKDIVFAGPTYRASAHEKNGLRIQFDHTEQGLVAHPVPATYAARSTEKQMKPLHRNSPSSELEGFTICGADRKWHWADARIEGNSVFVWSDTVSDPVAVRYAWTENPTCNLYNGAGLPAAPFRTDDFPPMSKTASN